MAYEPKGYHRLASLMSNDKDVAIFHRFDDLNILSLLALQAEIIDLEKDLRRECRIEDMMSNGPDPVYYSENFKLSREGNSEQYRKLTDIRNRLKEYSWLWLVPKRPLIIFRAG